MANCEYTQEKFKESRDIFKMMVEKAHSNDLEKMTSPDCSIAIKIAVSWAYNDAKRTMHGITKDDREEAEDAIVKEFKAYFTNPAPCEKNSKNLTKDYVTHGLIPLKTVVLLVHTAKLKK